MTESLAFRYLSQSEITNKDLKFTIRCYDKYDGYWFDVLEAMGVTLDTALEKWNECTENGTVYTKFEDGCYYAIFRADTRMIFSDR